MQLAILNLINLWEEGKEERKRKKGDKPLAERRKLRAQPSFA
jgi:hypothetical protein